MFNNSSNGGYSLSDVAAVVDGQNGNGWGGFGNGSGWWVILFIFALFGWGGNGFGWGNNGNNGTLNTDYLSTGIRDLTSSVANDFYTLNTGLLNGFCDTQNTIATNTAAVTAAVTNGFNTQNLANLQNTNAIQRDIYAGTVGNMQNTQALQSTLAGMAATQASDTASLNYNLATQMCATNTNNSNNTRDIIDAINASNRAVLDAMAQNKTEAMQDKINDLTAQLQQANLAASQAAQNNYLIDQLRPSPNPAYVVPNPYGCNCGYYNTMNTV